jgi:uncharacterized protein YdgA (DUF945 family)
MQYDYLKNINSMGILQDIKLRPKQQIYIIAKLNNIDISMSWESSTGEGLTFASAIYYIEQMLGGNKVNITDFYFDKNTNVIKEDLRSDYAIIPYIDGILESANLKVIKLAINSYTIGKITGNIVLNNIE